MFEAKTTMIESTDKWRVRWSIQSLRLLWSLIAASSAKSRWRDPLMKVEEREEKGKKKRWKKLFQFNCFFFCFLARRENFHNKFSTRWNPAANDILYWIPLTWFESADGVQAMNNEEKSRRKHSQTLSIFFEPLIFSSMSILFSRLPLVWKQREVRACKNGKEKLIVFTVKLWMFFFLFLTLTLTYSLSHPSIQSVNSLQSFFLTLSLCSASA